MYMQDNSNDKAVFHSDEGFNNKMKSVFHGSLSITSPKKDTSNAILLNESRKELINKTYEDYNTLNESFMASVPVPTVSANCSVKIGARLLNYIW